MVKSTTGNFQIQYHPEGPDGPVWDVDCTPPFKRLDMMVELQNILGVKFPDALEYNKPGILLKNEFFINVVFL